MICSNKDCGKVYLDDCIYYAGKNKHFCSADCFEAYLKQQKEIEDNNILQGEIKRIFGLKKLDGRMFQEIKRLHEGYELSYNNIALTLHYIYDIKKKAIFSPTLYYVPQFIAEAKNYYKNIEEQEQMAKEMLTPDTSFGGRQITPNYGSKDNSLKISIKDVLGE